MSKKCQDKSKKCSFFLSSFAFILSFVISCGVLVGHDLEIRLESVGNLFLENVAAVSINVGWHVKFAFVAHSAIIFRQKPKKLRFKIIDGKCHGQKGQRNNLWKFQKIENIFCF